MRKIDEGAAIFTPYLREAQKGNNFVIAIPADNVQIPFGIVGCR